MKLTIVFVLTLLGVMGSLAMPKPEPKANPLTVKAHVGVNVKSEAQPEPDPEAEPNESPKGMELNSRTADTAQTEPDEGTKEAKADGTRNRMLKGVPCIGDFMCLSGRCQRVIFLPAGVCA